MKVPYVDIVKAELMANNITLCENCNNGCSHIRGTAFVSYREIHLASKFQTRSTLYRFLHEVGHIVNGDHGLSWEQERDANLYAYQTMRAFGISVPHQLRTDWKDYVLRKKRHGDNIRKGKMGVL